VSIGDANLELFLFPTLEVIEKLGGSASNDEIDSALITEFGYTDEDIGETYVSLRRGKSDVSFLIDKMRWARSYLKLAGLLGQEKRGVWVVTDDGRLALAQGDEAVRRSVKTSEQNYHRDYREKQRAKSLQRSSSTVESIEPERFDDEIWQTRLLDRLKLIPPSDFERLSQRLLRESGFTKVEVRGKSGDGGIDGQGVLRVNLVSFNVLFQCKRYQGSVGAEVIRDFRGAMQGRADKGLIITTGTFTSSARQEATRDGAPSIDLIDGDDLVLLLKERGLGVRVETVERVIVDDLFFQKL
jgi:restriction system protein